MARWLEDNGNDGLVVAGTTGEAPMLTDDEKLGLWARRGRGRHDPGVAGTGTNDTAHSVHLTSGGVEARRGRHPGRCPYYNRPSQAGIEAHLRAVAGATDLPVMIYDIPIRTGRKVATARCSRLAREVPNIVALKDAAGEPGRDGAGGGRGARRASRSTAATTA